MKKIVMIFAAMAAVLSSCSKSELESVSENESKDIVLNISVSNPGADTKALIKTGWAAGDEISIWYDTNTGENPDLVIKYDASNAKWIQKEGATVSGNTPSTGNGYAKALYNGTVKVASKDNYTYENNTLTFDIAHWVFLTEIQVVVYGDDINWTKQSDYTLSCDKFTPCTGCSIGADGITATTGNKGTAVTGIINDGVNSKSGVAFVFATADYSSTAAAFKFTLTDNTSTSTVTKEYTATTEKISGTTGSMTAIKALTIVSSKFNVPVNPFYVEIAAKYDGSNTTTLKWYRQNLAISASGKKAWKGGNTSSAVKVPGTNDDVIVGDYFQWGASYKGYNLTAENQKPENLLIYTAFTHTGCGDSEVMFTFRSAGEGKTYRFNKSSIRDDVGISPYHNGSGYTKYNSDSKTVLERTPEVNDDVASIILGGDWHIPTADEFTAMQEATYWAWDETDQGYYVFKPGQGTAGVAGQYGDIAEADNKADALLFLPAAGYAYNTDFSDGYGNYWSSTLSDSDPEEFDYVYYLYFEDGSYLEPQGDYNYRENGLSIRPVSE